MAGVVVIRIGRESRRRMARVVGIRIGRPARRHMRANVGAFTIANVLTDRGSRPTSAP